MPIIINPGSNIGENTKKSKWTNTHQTAKKYAHNWFYKHMVESGFEDIEVEDTKKEIDGRWLFIFRHKVTGKAVELEIHGIDNIKEYQKENIFTPRIYWEGSSCSSPELEDFAKDGYKPVMTYKKIEMV